MILLETTDLEEILNSILNAFEHFNAWNSTMLELLSSNAMPQDLFSASYHVITSPFLLLDAGLRLLAYNTCYGIGDVDDIWDEMLKTGNMNMDFLISLNQTYPNRLREKKLYHHKKGLVPFPCYCQNFFFQNNWAGAVVFMYMTENITQGTLDLFSIFGEYLNRWFQIHIQEQNSIVLDQLIQTALSDNQADTAELQRQFILFGWEETDDLMLLKLDTPCQPYNINTYLCRTLSNHFTDLYAVPMELSICLLCNTTRCSFNQLTAQLIPWLERNKYYAVASQPFTMKDSFYDHYKYVELTSGCCGRTPGKIYDGANYTLPYIFYEMQNTIVPDILHPILKQLYEYDQENHTELYATLYCYLKNERSLIHTARELQLHRNSLSYRLNRISELWDVDLEDFHTRLHILISYEILSYQN